MQTHKYDRRGKLKVILGTVSRALDAQPADKNGLSQSPQGKVWLNWVTCNDLTGRVEEWHIPGKLASKRVRY